MTGEFNGAELRLARNFAGLSLDDVASRVDKTRQYLHKLETGQSTPTAHLMVDLAAVLQVEPDFFCAAPVGALAEEQVHFRKLFTTRAAIKQVAMARAELTGRLVVELERHLRLPKLRLPVIADVRTSEDIEQAAERCRREWELGLGPIADMTRLCEHVGAVVTTFKSISSEIDAMSFDYGRPIIVRNEAKPSACRQRFDIGHELAHATMHSGRTTGDHSTESEAHRFSGALLVPRVMMLKLFPRSRGQRLDWMGLSEFKRTWKISKAALLYRAKQLNLLTDAQYKTGVIHLTRGGQANWESEDESIPMEEPHLLRQALSVLAEKKSLTGPDIAKRLRISVELLEQLLGFSPPTNEGAKERTRPSLRLVA